MKTDSNYYDNTPLSTPSERLILLLIAMMGLVGFAVWSYLLW
jgi:hypothetical protein